MDANREELQDLHKELLVLKADYDELLSNLTKLGEKIFELWNKIDEKLN